MHTPTPWKRDQRECLVGKSGEQVLFRGLGSLLSGDPNDIKNAVDNTTLAIAAARSYDRHFGPNAVAAAESDVLGRLIDWAKSALNMVDGDGLPPDWDEARAVLAKVAATAEKKP